MSAPIAVRASYADFKLLKTRSVFQIVLEAPIEQAEDFVTAFGLPMPGAERPVAVALLNTIPEGPASAKVPASVSVTHGGDGAPDERATGPETNPAKAGNQAGLVVSGHAREAPQRCPTAAPDRVTQWFGIACGDPRFQRWCERYFDLVHGIVDRDAAANLVRQACGVKSRAEFSTNPVARQKALDLMLDYDQAMGQATEDRS